MPVVVDDVRALEHADAVDQLLFQCFGVTHSCLPIQTSSLTRLPVDLLAELRAPEIPRSHASRLIRHVGERAFFLR